MSSKQKNPAKRQAAEGKKANKRTKTANPSSSERESHIIAPKNAPALDFADGEPLLPRLLFPVTPEDFKASYAHRLPLHIRSFSVERIHAILEMFLDGDVSAIVENSASEKIHVWCKSSLDGKLQSVSMDDPKSAFHLYAAGHSIYCRAPSDVENEVVPKLLHELGLGTQNCENDKYTRGEIEMFCSRRGHVTDFHSDFQENFTIQLTGSKRWFVRPSSVQHPIRGCTPHYDSPEVAEQQLKVQHLVDGDFSFKQYEDPSVVAAEQVFEVKAGDVFYHPAGCWHRVECLEDGVSLNISLIAASYAELFSSGLTQLLWSDADWRRQVDTTSRENTLAHFSGLLDKLQTKLQTLQPEWFLPPMIFREQLNFVCEDGGCCDEEGKCGVGAHDHNHSHSHGDGHSHSHAHAHQDEEEEGDEEEVEEEEDEEEDESDGSDDSTAPKNILHVHKVDLEEQDIAILSDSNTTFAFNPLATVLRGTDLAMVGWTGNEPEAVDDFEVYVCHLGYGNENLDSISTCTFSVVKTLGSLMERIIARSQQAKTAAAAVTITIGQFQISKQDQVEAMQLLKSLEFCGVVYLQ